MNIRRKLQSFVLAMIIAATAAVPAAAAGPWQSWLVDPQAIWVVTRVLANTLNQFVTGKADYAQIANLFASLPVVSGGSDEASATLLQVLRDMQTIGVFNGTVALKETGEEGVFLLGALYNDLLHREKQVFDFFGEITYDSRTGFFQGEDGRGVFGIGFDYDSKQYMVRNAAQAWTKAAGYNELYDFLAPFIGILLDTLRFPFSYDGYDWMVQLWKGSYFTAFNGAEIGLYRKPKDRLVNHYDCADINLPLSLKVFRGEDLLFSTGEHESWWMAGFQYGNPFLNIVPAMKLRVEGAIKFMEKGMLEAFYAVFNKLKPAGITGELDGLLFSFLWEEKV